MVMEKLYRSDWLAPRRFLDVWQLPEMFSGLPRYVDEVRLEELVIGDEFVIRAELPGIDPDNDLEISVTDQTLRMRADRHEKKETTTEKRGYRSEFRYGTFERRVALPAGVSEHDLKATYEDGILEVRFPIHREASEATKIPVQRV